MEEASRENPYSLPYKLAADKVIKKEALSSLRNGHDYTKTAIETMELLLDTLIPLYNPLEDDLVQQEVRRTKTTPSSRNLEPPITIEELDLSLKKKNREGLLGQTSFHQKY